MNETRAVLRVMSHQLKALTVTVAALENFAEASGLKGDKLTDLKVLMEQMNEEIFTRLQSLIDAIPNET
jgi:hypothetical protein